MSANYQPPATPPAAVPPVQPPAEGAPPPAAPIDPKEVEALRTHVETMKKDNAKLREMLRTTKAAAPPPDAAAAAAAATAKAQADAARAQRIRVAALESLIGKVGATPEQADFIAWKAGQDPSVTVGDDGAVVGLDEHVARALGAFPKPAAPASATPPPAAPQIARPNAAAEPPDPRFANVKSFSDLLAMGAVAFSDFSEKYPTRFAQLEAAARNVR